MYSGVLVRDFGMQYLGVPLHTVYLESDLVTGPVVVGTWPCIDGTCNSQQLKNVR